MKGPHRRRGVAPRALAAVRTTFYWAVKAAAAPVTLIYVRLAVSGRGHVPRGQPCIVVANHTSYVDAAVLGSACPRRITFMISEPIYRLLRLRWFYYLMGTIPVAADAPDPSAMKAALRTLREGGVVGIFPEGQRMPDGNVGEGKAGVALLAARSRAVVIPAAIIGAHRVMPVGSIVPRPYRIRVVFGAPISFPASRPRRPSREQLDAFADQVMVTVRRLMQRDPSARSAKERAVRSTEP